MKNLRQFPRAVAVWLAVAALTLSACQGAGIGTSNTGTPISPQGTLASPPGAVTSPQAGLAASPSAAANPTLAAAVSGSPAPLTTLGSPIYSSNFANPNQTELTFLGPPTTTAHGVEAGAYWISAAQAWQAAWAAAPPSVADFVAKTTVSPHGDPVERGYGIAFRIRQQSDGTSSYYLFWMNPSTAQYALHRVDRGVFVELVGWRRSAAVRGEGQPNKLTVRAKGPRIDLYANDEPLVTVADETYSEGRIALYFSAWSIPDVRGDFFNFTLYPAQ